MTILFAYDVESKNEQSKKFLVEINNYHTDINVPYTIFITGETAIVCNKELADISSNPLCCIGQHTNKHIPIKSLFTNPDRKQRYNFDAEFGESIFISGFGKNLVKRDIFDASEAIEKITGYKPTCFCAPYGFFNGLSESAEILEILREAGIYCITTDTRSPNGCNSATNKERPYFYGKQGFAEILEVPSCGYQDDLSYACFAGRFDYAEYIEEKILKNTEVITVKTHDFYLGKEFSFENEKKQFLDKIITCANKNYTKFSTYEKVYAEYFKEAIVERGQARAKKI